MRPRSRDGAQALVEFAIVFPLFILLVLGIIQVSMIARALLYTKYAAYCAARCGIVNSAVDGPMERAVTLALIPVEVRGGGIARSLIGIGRTAIFSSVERVTPTAEDFRRFGVKRRDDNGRTIAFRDPRAAAARSRLLTVHVTYYYRLDIPVVKHVILGFYKRFDPQRMRLPVWSAFIGRIPLEATYTMRMQSDAKESD